MIWDFASNLDVVAWMSNGGIWYFIEMRMNVGSFQLGDLMAPFQSITLETSSLQMLNHSFSRRKRIGNFSLPQIGRGESLVVAPNLDLMSGSFLKCKFQMYMSFN